LMTSSAFSEDGPWMRDDAAQGQPTTTNTFV
jgi:hypothetical protein